MSEPVGTEDREDVVASVRRLVSPEARPRAVLPVPGPDLLVLTPALRVVPEREAPLVLVLTEPAVEPEPQLPAPAPDGAPDGALAPVPDGASDVTPAPVPVEPESRFQVVDDDWLDAFRDERDGAAGHDGQAAAPVPDAESLAPELLDAELLAAEALDASQAGEAETDPPPGPTSVVAFPQCAEIRVSLAATADTATPDTARLGEPDGDPDGDLKGDLSRLTDPDGNPVTVIDEAALHEIVRALIREELQGVLGERITCNVRKLVRAEINRALAARALD